MFPYDGCFLHYSLGSWNFGQGQETCFLIAFGRAQSARLPSMQKVLVLRVRPSLPLLYCAEVGGIGCFAEFLVASWKGFANFIDSVVVAIENGMPWPKDLIHAKAVPIRKPDSGPAQPLSYRVLTILPSLYRL